MKELNVYESENYNGEKTLIIADELGSEVVIETSSIMNLMITLNPFIDL